MVISSSLFRTRKLAIPYSAIDGAFHFKVEPIKAISYRHTYRMYGSMDRRDIWSLVYNMPNTDKVSRVLMKASEEFWEAFEKKLPGRIRVSQEEVLKNAFLYISGAEPKKNKNRAKKAAAADALEEAEEARAQESAQGAGPQAAPQDAASEIRDASETAAPAPAEESAPEKEPAAAPSGEAEAADKAETAKKKKNKATEKGSPEKETPLFYCLFPPDTASPSFPAAGSSPAKGTPHRSGARPISAERIVISRRQSAPLSSGSPRERGLPREGSARSGGIHTPR